MKKEVVYVKQKTSYLTWFFLIFIVGSFLLGLLVIQLEPDNKPVKATPKTVVFMLQDMEEIPEGFFLSGGIRNYTRKPVVADVAYRIYEDETLIIEGNIENFLNKNLDPGKGTTFGEVIEYNRKPDATYTYEMEVIADGR